MPEVDHDKVMLLTNRGTILAELIRHPAWPELQRMASEQEGEYYTSLAKKLARGMALDQRQLDFDRGYWEGVKDMLAAPDKAVKKMRRALEQAERGIAEGGDNE